MLNHNNYVRELKNSIGTNFVSFHLKIQAPLVIFSQAIQDSEGAIKGTKNNLT